MATTPNVNEGLTESEKDELITVFENVKYHTLRVFDEVKTAFAVLREAGERIRNEKENNS